MYNNCVDIRLYR